MTRLRARWSRLPQKAKIPLLGLAGLLMLYLLLVGVGGGLGPQRNDHFAWSGDSLLLFAHRGVAVEVPENSEASLAAALEAGFQAVEIDVRKTRDGELALFHDRSALRMIGLDAEVGDLTLAQIKARKLRFKEVETPFTAPTLREVFQKFGGRLLFYLDMKNTGFKDADQIVGLIREFGLEERTILASVDPLFVAYVEQHYPAVNTALERFDPYQMVLYRLIPTRWKPDFLSGFARKVSPAHARWLREEQLLSNRIVYEAGGTNYDRVLGFGITKAIVDYDPQVHAQALAGKTAVPGTPGR